MGAQKRGLSNLNTTPKAIKTWAQEKTEARAEVMYEAYNTTMGVEANTMVEMVRTGILPACAKDLATYKDAPALAGGRAKLYETISTETDKLSALMKAVPHDDLAKEAEYLCETVKPQMAAIRAAVDEAEGLLEASLYPYPTYESMLYHHHH